MLLCCRQKDVCSRYHNKCSSKISSLASPTPISSEYRPTDLSWWLWYDLLRVGLKGCQWTMKGISVIVLVFKLPIFLLDTTHAISISPTVNHYSSPMLSALMILIWKLRVVKEDGKKDWWLIIDGPCDCVTSVDIWLPQCQCHNLPDCQCDNFKFRLSSDFDDRQLVSTTMTMKKIMHTV